MALNTYYTIPDALVRKAWAKDLWSVSMNTMFFGKFMGTSSDNIIQVKEDLKKDSGDQITIGLRMKLKNEGIKGDDTLEGNEEPLIFRDFAVSIDQIRNAVKTKGKMEEQKVPYNLRQEAKDALSVWLQEVSENAIITALTTDPTADRIVYGGTATSESALTASDTFTADIIGKAKRIAMANEFAKIRPVRVEGKSYYVMLVDPWQARDLQNDEKWRRAQEYAADRGSNNPIFTGSLGVYDGVVIHMNENLPRTESGASSAKVGHALFLGAQAAVLAVGKEPTWDEESFDYGNQIGVSYGRIWGVKKTQFKFDDTNPTDFGVINVLTSSADD